MTIHLTRADIFSVVGDIIDRTAKSIEQYRFDAISLNDTVYLVPEWLAPQEETHRMPARTIEVPQRLLLPEENDPEIRYWLRGPIPKSVVDGTVSSQGGYKSVELGSIRVQFASH